uniref:Solute carrier family 2, facilitated glucose transporter member 9-like n=1 Tax=Crocodylus porosus TaxID=8502 RepID=A0A7M4FZC0_CROPO
MRRQISAPPAPEVTWLGRALFPAGLQLRPGQLVSLAANALLLSPQPLTFPLLSVTLLASFGSSMLYGYNLAVVNSPAVHIKAFYNLTWTKRYGQGLSPGLLTLMYSLTVSVFALGGLVGSLPVGVLVTRYGSTLLVFLASALMGFSRALASPEMIITGRFITGIHSGVCLSVVPMYLGEIAPKNLRGFLGLVPSIFICLGVFSAQLLGLPELLGEVSTRDPPHLVTSLPGPRTLCPHRHGPERVPSLMHAPGQPTGL